MAQQYFTLLKAIYGGLLLMRIQIFTEKGGQGDNIFMDGSTKYCHAKQSDGFVNIGPFGNKWPYAISVDTSLISFQKILAYIQLLKIL